MSKFMTTSESYDDQDQIINFMTKHWDSIVSIMEDKKTGIPEFLHIFGDTFTGMTVKRMKYFKLKKYKLGNIG